MGQGGYQMGLKLLSTATCPVNNTELLSNIESKMDFISNAIIDLILCDSKRYTKWGLPNFDESNKLIVKGDVKE
mgnify:CR=1 FL=1